MIVYLTSHIGGSYKQNGTRIPTQLSTENGLLDSLKKHWKDNAKVLIISADADDIETNDSILNIFAAAFPMSGLAISQMFICDKRNEKLVDKIADYDVLILAGGHVPTQNKFLKRIRLKERLNDFDGILIGISAGTMNSAEVVYAQPELEGESIDKEYLDGQRLFEDITYPDSHGWKTGVILWLKTKRQHYAGRHTLSKTVR